MPRSVFFVPMVGTGVRDDPFRAKYQSPSDLSQPATAVSNSGNLRYSRISRAILMLDAQQAYLDLVAAQPDADFWFAETGIDAEIGGQRNNQFRSLLDPLGIPATWVNANNNWREITRGIAGMFLFAQRHEGLNDRGFFEDLEAAGFSLNTRWNQLSTEFQNTISATITDFGWAITPEATSQVRALLKQFSDQFVGTRIFIAGLEI